MSPPTGRRAALLLAVSLTVTVAFGALFAALSGFGNERAGATASASPAAARASAGAPSLPPDSGCPTSAAGASSQATIDPPLPALVASIGDSIGVAFDADGLGPEPGHEWTMGTAKGDGVFSLLERFQALGADPIVADEAKAGARMIDAAGQARLVLASAQKLRAGQTAFVTIELGGNDACAATPAATFEAQLRNAISILRSGATATGGAALSGLPRGSRLLVLSVPNIVHLRSLTAGIPEAQDIYGQFGLCSRYLGAAVTAAQLQTGLARIETYNSILARVCADVQATDGKAGRLYCRSDQQGASAGSMFGSDFTLADVSQIDFFHPSLAGQARIADGAWAAGYWSAVTPPASAG